MARWISGGNDEKSMGLGAGGVSFVSSSDFMSFDEDAAHTIVLPELTALALASSEWVPTATGRLERRRCVMTPGSWSSVGKSERTG